MEKCQVKSCSSYDAQDGCCIASVNPSECIDNFLYRLKELHSELKRILERYEMAKNVEGVRWTERQIGMIEIAFPEVLKKGE